MNLDIDDDSVDGLLVKLLRRANHDVLIPNEIGKDGAADADHLLEAIRQSRTLLTMNYGDFEALHRLITFLGGHHSGVLIVRRDNDPKRDMDQKRIVRAIRNLQSSGVPIADDCHILNRYR